MTTPTNYTRDAILRMKDPTRRGLLLAARNKVNADPDNTDELTRVWWAIACQIIDCDQDEADVMADLEKAFRL